MSGITNWGEVWIAHEVHRHVRGSGRLRHVHAKLLQRRAQEGVNAFFAARAEGAEAPADLPGLVSHGLRFALELLSGGGRPAETWAALVDCAGLALAEEFTLAILDSSLVPTDRLGDVTERWGKAVRELVPDFFEPNQALALVLLPSAGIEPGVLLRASQALGMHPSDAAQRLITKIPKVLEVGEDTAMQGLFAGLRGLPVLLVATELLRVPPRMVSAVALEEGGVKLTLAEGGEEFLSLEEPALVVRGLYTVRSERLKTTSATQRPRFGIKKTKATHRSNRVPFAHVYTAKDPTPLCLVQNELDYTFLGDEMGPVAHGNFETLIGKLSAPEAVELDDSLLENSWGLASAVELLWEFSPRPEESLDADADALSRVLAGVRFGARRRSLSTQRYQMGAFDDVFERAAEEQKALLEGGAAPPAAKAAEGEVEAAPSAEAAGDAYESSDEYAALKDEAASEPSASE